MEPRTLAARQCLSDRGGIVMEGRNGTIAAYADVTVQPRGSHFGHI